MISASAGFQDPTIYSHASDRAVAALERAKMFPGGKGRLFELALPKFLTIEGQLAGEAMAQRAAAKLVAKLRNQVIVDVWTEDGVHPEHGKYRIWFLLTAPVSGRC